MLNIASRAFNELNIIAGFSSVTLPTHNPPFFELDSGNTKFILNVDVLGFDDKITNHISIHVTQHYTLIPGFQASYYGPNVSNSSNEHTMTNVNAAVAAAAAYLNSLTNTASSNSNGQSNNMSNENIMMRSSLVDPSSIYHHHHSLNQNNSSASMSRHRF